VRSRSSSGRACARRSPAHAGARPSEPELPAFTLEAVGGLPEVRPGDDLAALLTEHAELHDGDVLVVAHKVVSKAEGRVRRLGDVDPGERARELATEHGKDPRAVQVVLDETATLLRAERGVLICETRHGYVCANAGVDASNSDDPDELVLLPDDPDASARELRRRIGLRIGVIVSDSFGRAWRLGQTDVAIGAAGIEPLDDWRGRSDYAGRELRATAIAVADSVAAAADLARAKDSREPAVVVRGLGHLVAGHDGPGAAALRRPPEEDLFR
jgi:coenzyme F420-0:L-glutamate ligase/coenzyme F420-1:gamma-L-glutamate ligase